MCICLKFFWKSLILVLIISIPSTVLSGEELCVSLVCRDLTWTDKFKHCGTFIHECGKYTEDSIKNQYSLQGFAFQYDPENSESSTYKADRKAFLNINDSQFAHQKIAPPPGMEPNEFIDLIRMYANLYKAEVYWPYGPNSNSAADFPLYRSGVDTNEIEGALGLHHYHRRTVFDEIVSDAVKLFYEQANEKLKGLINQIKSETITNGNFKNLNIGDSKSAVIKGLRQMQAYYVSTQGNKTLGTKLVASNGMIDLRPGNDKHVESRLYAADTWNVTYDSNGETFWYLQLDFTDEKLSEVTVKSSKLELP